MNINGINITSMPCGESAIKTYGSAFPEKTKRAVDDADAILFGATEESAIQVLAYLRWGLGNFANVRPIKYFKGMDTTLKPDLVKNVDYTFVRETTQGMYAAAGKEGKLRKLIKKGLIYDADIERWTEKAIYALRIVSPEATDKIGRVACDLCIKRKNEGIGKGLLEIVCKPNVLRRQDQMFINRIKKIAQDHYPQIEVETYIVDDFARRLIRYPDYHDTIVIPNMMGDILSDEAAEIVGGLGVAGSGVYGPKTSYFEPTHGSAPAVLQRKNYAGEPVANPIAAIISTVLMLDYLNYTQESHNLMKAVENTLIGGQNPQENWKYLPRDAVPTKFRKNGKFGSTQDVANKILDEYRKIC
jgi:isocitrate/isopropylmalate dehydrogenase